jgi:prepilin-type N-terminal cleavage/methylation domain-containing protein
MSAKSNIQFARRVNSGFSLIELMIALLLSLVIVGAVGYVYVGNQESMRTQTADSRLTDTKRIALDALTRDLRIGARMGCTRARGGIDQGALLVTANFPVMANTRDALNYMMQDKYIRNALEPAWFIRSFDNGVGYLGPTTGTRVPGSDVIQIIKTGEYASHLATAMTSPSDDPDLASEIPGARPGSSKRLFLISDCTRSEIIRATVNDSTAYPGGKLNINATDYNENKRLRNAYKTDAFVSPFDPVVYMVQEASEQATVKSRRLVKYSLSTDTAKDQNGAWSPKFDIVADGIEDIQIRFGVDRLGLAGNAPDTLMTASEINASGATAEERNQLWEKVRSVEINLTIEGRTQEGKTLASPLRQQITHTVSLRNRT